MSSLLELDGTTWIPYAGIKKSVESLGNYELEQSWQWGYHTLRTLLGCRNPITSPTVRLWQGYETALANYLHQVIRQVYSRGMREYLEFDLFNAIIVDGPKIQSNRVAIHLPSVMGTTKHLQSTSMLPPWFGWKQLHVSHRVALQTGDTSMIVWPWEGNVNGSVRTVVLQGR